MSRIKVLDVLLRIKIHKARFRLPAVLARSFVYPLRHLLLKNYSCQDATARNFKFSFALPLDFRKRGVYAYD